jgi:hypothetical protein
MVERALVDGVDVFAVQVEALRAFEAGGGRRLGRGAEGAFRREHQHELALVGHLDVDRATVVMHFVLHAEIESIAIEIDGGRGVAHGQVRDEPRRIGGAGEAHDVLLRRKRNHFGWLV